MVETKHKNAVTPLIAVPLASGRTSHTSDRSVTCYMLVGRAPFIHHAKFFDALGTGRIDGQVS